MHERVLIIGAGNWMCGDEAAGIAVANELGRRLGPLARVSYHAELLQAISDDPQATDVDAILFVASEEHSADHPAGTWRRVDGRRGETCQLPSEYRDQVAELAGHLRDSDTHVWVYALAGVDFQLGASFSAPVLGAVGQLVSRIESDLATELDLRAEEALPVGA